MTSGWGSRHVRKGILPKRESPQLCLWGDIEDVSHGHVSEALSLEVSLESQEVMI